MHKNYKHQNSVSSNSIKSSEDEEENTITLYDIVKNRREISDVKEEKNFETQESMEKKRDQPFSKRRGHQAIQNNLNAPVARLVYAAMLKDNVESIKVKEIIDKLINEELLQNDDEYSNRDYQLNGFLLIKGKFFIHFIEGDTQIINQKYIKDFLYANYKELQQDDDMGQQQSFFQQINIIAFTEENPKKIFDKHYSFQDNQSPQLATDLEKTEEQIQDRTWEIYHKFCEVALKQYTKKNKSQEAKMASELVFSNDDWSMLMMKYYMSIEDYYEMYLDDPIIQLDSEMVYPFTPSLINNLEYSERGYFPQVKL